MTRKMKDSGIEWIGQIPEDWGTTKLLFALDRPITDGPHETPSYVEEGVPFITINNIDELGNIDKENSNKISAKDALMYNKKAKMKIGDLLFSKSATIGKIAEVDELDFMVWSPFAILSPKKDVLNRKYLKLLLMLPNYVNHIINLGSVNTQVNVGMRDMEKSIIPLTNINNQIKISNFLEKEIRHLDFIKTTIFNQIRTLEDYKKSVITEAVTKGLDKNVEMKDSGIEWIGEIPKHWIKAKVKHACALIGSGTTPTSHNLEFYSEDGINWIQSGDLYKTSIITTTEKRISDTALKYYSVLKLYESPFLVMAMYGASVGNLSLSKINATTNQACCVMKPNKKTDLMFLYYWLVFVKDDLLNKAEGGSQPNISQDKIKNEIMYFPTLCEQQSISNYLDKKTAIIDEAITSKQKQLGILEEYKKSLIYEYVTGKKEVEDVGTI